MNEGPPRPRRKIPYPAHAAGVLVVACILAAVFTPSPDAVSLLLLWLVLTIALGAPYLGVLWLVNRKRGPDQDRP